MKILVTGCTGYVGGRLIPRLLERGHKVRVLTRSRKRMEGRPWVNDVEVVEGDVLQPQTLAGIGDGCDAGYYLVHSMSGKKGDFEKQDHDAAENFCRAVADIPHVIYLGGLMPDVDDASKHLRSRAEVGKVLADHVPVTEFRAGPIVGSGSASFEMIRYLTERLPFMIAPRWVLNEVSPIGIRSMLDYLIAALEAGPQGIVEVGSDEHSFIDLMRQYAEVRGLRRVIVPVPPLAPWLAARWVGLVTPIPNQLAVPLVCGMLYPLKADTSKARDLYPKVDPLSYKECVQAALQRVDESGVETRWSTAGGNAETVDVDDWEGCVTETRTLVVDEKPEDVFAQVCTVGGQRGWGGWVWAWRLRGLFDRVIGGPGLRRGRRDPKVIFPGEALDFWRVENVEPGRLLRLRAEMKVPGEAWLQWECREEESGTRLVQTAFFRPKGFWGAVYWYSLYPAHKFVFSDLIRFAAGK